jgi:hypothetical protein
MKFYRVTWEIDVHAKSPRAAAETAQLAQRDPQSRANRFHVRKSNRTASVDSVYTRVFPDDEIIDLSKTRSRGKK